MCQTLSDRPPADPISFISMNTYAKALFPVLFERNRNRTAITSNSISRSYRTTPLPLLAIPAPPGPSSARTPPVHTR